jgi:hypothetical protein
VKTNLSPRFGFKLEFKFENKMEKKKRIAKDKGKSEYTAWAHFQLLAHLVPSFARPIRPSRAKFHSACPLTLSLSLWARLPVAAGSLRKDRCQVGFARKTPWSCHQRNPRSSRIIRRCYPEKSWGACLPTFATTIRPGHEAPSFSSAQRHRTTGSKVREGRVFFAVVVSWL